MPVRLGHTIKMLTSSECPINLKSNLAFQKITSRYLEDISFISQLPKPVDQKTETDFTNALKLLKTRHRNNLFFIGQGLKELLTKSKNQTDIVKDDSFQRFFDRFYAVNLGTQLLIDEEIALIQNGINLVQRLTPYNVATEAIEDAIKICKGHYGFVPKVELRTTNKYLSTVYIKEYLHRILFELVKYTIKCTIKHHGRNPSLVSKAEPITMVIAEGNEDVSIKISDQAGGHPLSENDNVWRYMRPKPIMKYSSKSFDEYKEYYKMPINSYLHAMPITRMMARYFGGDMTVYPMEGYGTDTFVYLSRTENTRENIPEDVTIITKSMSKELENLDKIIRDCNNSNPDADGFIKY